MIGRCAFLFGSCMALASVGCGSFGSAKPQIVRNAAPTVPAAWAPKRILGKDLHPMVRGPYFWTDDWKDCPDDLPFFRDVTVQYPVSVGVSEWSWRNNRYVPVKSPRPDGAYTIEDMLRRAEPSLSIRSRMRPDLPFMLVQHDGRPPFFLRDGYSNDREGYAKWLKANPNFIGYLTFSEFESDLSIYRRTMKAMEDSPAKVNAGDWTEPANQAFDVDSSRVVSIVFATPYP